MKDFSEFLVEAAKKPAKKKAAKKTSWTDNLVKKVEGLVKKTKSDTKKQVKKQAEKKGSKWDNAQAPGTRVIFPGRFNPITSGHVAAITKAKAHADKIGAEFEVIVPHHTGQDEQNPLDHKTKMAHIKAALPGVKIVVGTPGQPSLMHHVKRAYDEGMKHLLVWGGGDRIEDYHKLLNKYNGTPAGGYRFDSIGVKNAGKRGPGIVSATQQREYAVAGDWENFRRGSPFPKDFVKSRQLMRDVSQAERRVAKEKEKRKHKKR